MFDGLGQDPLSDKVWFFLGWCLDVRGTDLQPLVPVVHLFWLGGGRKCWMWIMRAAMLPEKMLTLAFVSSRCNSSPEILFVLCLMLFETFIYLLHMCSLSHTHHSMYVEVRGQLAGVVTFL